MGEVIDRRFFDGLFFSLSPFSFVNQGREGRMVLEAAAFI